MGINGNNDNMLSVLEGFTLSDADDVAMQIANDFKQRRIERNLTREQVADKSGVAISNLARFEQKGMISLKNLINIAMALDYTSELKAIFSVQKYDTMEELTQIRRNMGKKRAYHK